MAAGCTTIRSSPTLTNCTFTGNSAAYGGGIYNSLLLAGADELHVHRQLGLHGGGMFDQYSRRPDQLHVHGQLGQLRRRDVHHSSPTLTNCTFTGNSANRGGGMYNSSTPPRC